MREFRLLMRRHLPVAWALIALTLAMKLIVPAGYMPSVSSGRVAIVMCSGMGPLAMARAMHGAGDVTGHAMALAMRSGMAMSHDDQHPMPTKPDQPCAGAGLNAPGLAGADPIQLAIALAAVLVAGLAGVTVPAFLRSARLRPPLRAPPALA